MGKSKSKQNGRDVEAKSITSVKQGAVTKSSQTPKSKSKEVAKQAVKAREASKKSKVKEPSPSISSASENEESEDDVSENDSDSDTSSASSASDEEEEAAPQLKAPAKTNGVKAKILTKTNSAKAKETSESSASSESSESSAASDSESDGEAAAKVKSKEPQSEDDSDDSDKKSEDDSDAESDEGSEKLTTAAATRKKSPTKVPSEAAEKKVCRCHHPWSVRKRTEMFSFLPTRSRIARVARIQTVKALIPTSLHRLVRKNKLRLRSAKLKRKPFLLPRKLRLRMSRMPQSAICLWAISHTMWTTSGSDVNLSNLVNFLVCKLYWIEKLVGLEGKFVA